MLIFQYNFYVFYNDGHFLPIMFVSGLFQKLLSKVTILSINFFDAIVTLNRELR